MKITFDRLFKLPLSGINTYILYGNDESVIERALSFLKQTYATTHTVQLVDSLDNFSSPSPSLFDDDPRPFVSILRTSSEKVIRSSVSQDPNISIFISPHLRAKSPVIVDSQSQPQLCSISCYDCALLPDELKYRVSTKGLALSQNQLRALYNAFKTEPDALSNCLSILALSEMWDDSAFNALLESLVDKSSGLLLLPTLLEKNIAAFDRATEIELDSETLIPTLRSLTRSFEILLAQKSQLSTLPHTVFFKDQPLFQNALKKWTIAQIQTVLKTLLALEDEVKFKQISPTIIQQKIRFCLTPSSH